MAAGRVVGEDRRALAGGVEVADDGVEHARRRPRVCSARMPIGTSRSWPAFSSSQTCEQAGTPAGEQRLDVVDLNEQRMPGRRR